jgi:hypothetical protein
MADRRRRAMVFPHGAKLRRCAQVSALTLRLGK